MSTLYGIDLSDVNGETFNGATFSPDIAFCGIKVTQGDTYKDRAFVANIDAIRSANIIPIFYLYWAANDDPQAQYDEYMSRGIDWSKPGLWAIDVENGNTDNWVQANQAQAQSNLRQLITLLQVGTQHQKGIIYTYHGYWVPTFGDPHSFTDCLLWDANYSSQIMNPFGGWVKPDIWQFSQFGNTQEAQPAVKADIDWNIWEDAPDELNTLANIVAAWPLL